MSLNLLPTLLLLLLLWDAVSSLQLLSCNFGNDSEISPYISARVRYYFNSTENDTQNELNIAVAKGQEARGELLAIVLREIFRYPDAKVVEASSCEYPFACAIKLDELQSLSDHYIDSGFLFRESQTYYYGRTEHRSCPLNEFGSRSEADMESGFPRVDTMQAACDSSNNLRNFAPLLAGGFVHLAKRLHQQKKLLLTSLAAYDAQLESFLQGFALPESAPTTLHGLCDWLRPVLKEAAISQEWNLGRMSTDLMPLTLALLWPNGSKLNDSSILTAAEKATSLMNGNFGNISAGANSSSSSSSLQRRAVAAALKAAGLRLRLATGGADCNKADALHFFSRVTCQSSPTNPLLGVIAGTCSETVGPVADLSSHSRSVVVSPTVESVAYSNVESYPYFFRTVPSLAAYSETVVKYLTTMGWPDVALLSSGKLFLRREEFERDGDAEGGLKVCFEEVADEEALTLDHTMEALRSAKAKKCQVYAMDYLKRGTCLYLCAAFKLNMLLSENYLFILANRAMDVFYNDSVACVNTGALDRQHGCTEDEIRQAANGHLIVHNFVATDQMAYATDTENAQESQMSLFYYGAYTTRAVQLMAYALADVVQADPSAVYHLNSPRVAALYKAALENTSFVDFQLSPSHGIDRGYMMVVARTFRRRMTTNSTKSFFFNIASQQLNNSVATTHLSKYRWQQFGTAAKPRLLVTPVTHAVVGAFPTANGDFIARFPTEDNCTTGFMRVFYKDLTCHQTIVVLIVSIFLVCLAIVFCCFVALVRYYRKHEVEKLTQPFQQIRDRLADVEIPKQQVVLNRKMGKGCFGTVFGGEVNLRGTRCGGGGGGDVGGISGWTSCAVKVMNEDLKQEAIVQFLEEAATLAQLKHENIVQLLGVCTGQEPFYIVMEMCLNGDLKSFLMARRTQALSNTTQETGPAALTRYAIDVARGVEYLHDRHMVHRDLALRNCMINDRLVVKVGDFGLARNIKEYYRVQNNKMVPVRWMPPESIQYMYFTMHSDIWSFAVVLYEIVTFGKFPFQELSQQQVIAQVSRGLTLFSAFPADARPELRSLVGRCWQFEPLDRPSIGQVLDALLSCPECVTPCLDEAPPHQPMEALRSPSSGDHLHLRGLGRHASGGDRSGAAAAAREGSIGASTGRLCDSGAAARQQVNSLSVNSTFSMGRLVSSYSGGGKSGRVSQRPAAAAGGGGGQLDDNGQLFMGLL